MDGLNSYFSRPLDCISINFYGSQNIEYELLFYLSGYFRSPSSTESSLTYLVDLIDPVAFVKNLESKWRNQYRKASNYGIKFKFANNDQMRSDYTKIHCEMEEHKKINVASVKKINGICERLDKDAKLLIGYENFIPICGCVVLFTEGVAYYEFAASSKRGREISAANFMVVYLVELLNNLGYKKLDLVGVEPKGNHGVYKFKRGTNAILTKQCGHFIRIKNNAFVLIARLFLVLY